ncbi:aspartate aminotransferase [candidate division WOR-3 bacterium JGI_Cruoil_03_51_56]|uniref:Aminotransferase n=1 Tax=candidate division WOR-3 bacterium JGI_Cruoil_03_51_56 TaxID=1973747 RepID=A0A235BXD2_UNCW3|nr:MAG: aspartate aminotransferase [candidate division WOR-3 bacterium JGI_Cruoil_03_51_56]
MKRLAKRMSRLGTETAFDCLCRAKALEHKMEVVHLEIGEPDFDTPKHICESAKRAIDQGWTHYGPSAGLPELREAIADYAGRVRGIRFSPEQVVVTPGGKPVMAFAIMALVEEGDEVIYPNPGFPIYESMISYMGGRPVPIQLREEKDFRLDAEEMASLMNPRTKLIIINSPQNPTGGVLTREDLRMIADIAQKSDAWVLADEIYSEILYEGKFESISQFPEISRHLIILDGFSKTFAMTGWRIGYGIMPAEMATLLAKIQTNTNSCTASFTQRACLDALKGPHDEVNQMVAEFRRRRDTIVDGLNEIPGFRCKKPAGAFYAFPNTEGTGTDCEVLADRLLEESGVACLAGTCFGKYGNGFIRFSYANSVENIEKALEKVRKALANR